MCEAPCLFIQKWSIREKYSEVEEKNIKQNSSVWKVFID